jgi:hypothetical protein
VPVVPPLVTPSQKNNTALYSALGGVLGAGLGLAITIQLYPQGTPNATLPARNFPPRNLSVTQTWAPGAVLETEAVAVAREAELDLGAARPEERGAAQAFPHCVPDLTSHLPARPAMSATAY